MAVNSGSKGKKRKVAAPEESKPRVKFYYITEDLDHLITRWCGEKRVPPSKRFFTYLRKEFNRTLQSVAFPSLVENGDSNGDANEDSPVRIECIDRTSLSHLKKRPGSKDFWITLDDVYVDVNPTSDCNLQMTRLYDRDGKKLEVAQRPGTPKIADQIEECRAKYLEHKDKNGNKAQVILADDGTYTGESIVKALEDLEREEIIVDEIRLAFSTDRSFDKLREYLASRPHRTPVKIQPGYVAYRELFLRDWVCERDFYIGVPRSGRTVGRTSITGAVLPYEPAIGLPYIDGLGSISDGASITDGRYALSASLTSYSIMLWNLIETKNKDRVGPMTVRDLPRFPGPGYDYESKKDIPLIEYLEDFEADKFSTEKLRDQRMNIAWYKRELETP